MVVGDYNRLEATTNDYSRLQVTSTKNVIALLHSCYNWLRPTKTDSSRPQLTTLLCITGGEGGESNWNFGRKIPQVHLIIIREWPKNNPRPLF